MSEVYSTELVQRDQTSNFLRWHTQIYIQSVKILKKTWEHKSFDTVKCCQLIVKYLCYAPFQFEAYFKEYCYKGPVKLIKRVKIAHSFLQAVSNQFHVIILNLPMWFYKWLSKNFSKHTSKNGEKDCLKLSLLVESF